MRTELVQLDGDALRLEEYFHALGAEFAADAALLVSAERHDGNAEGAGAVTYDSTVLSCELETTGSVRVAGSIGSPDLEPADDLLNTVTNYAAAFF